MPGRADVSADREPYARLWLYRAIAALPWPATYVGRLCLICFLGASVPVAGAAGFAAWRLGFPPRDIALVFAATLGAGVLASLAVLVAVRGALAPVLLSSEALRQYAADRRVPELPTTFGDEAGRLMRQVQETVVSFESAQAELRAHADTDPLTGIANRRYFFARAGDEVGAARRRGGELSLITFDLDHFKPINDEHGHAVGDAVLRLVTGAVARQMRGYDKFARIGGEEFAILLPGTGLSDAVGVAERLRRMVADLPLPLLHGRNVTASFGVARLERDDEDVDFLMHRADLALYEAKRGGRNRVVCEPAVDMPAVAAAQVVRLSAPEPVVAEEVVWAVK